jgi:membrane protein YqaA with SNARE-associated domain
LNSSKDISGVKIPSGFEGLSQRLLRQAATGHWFNAVCGGLALVCSLFAFPVIPIIISACLIFPQRWRSLSFSIALGCSLGATILVTLFHFFGWALIYKYFPEFLNHPAWQSVMAWVSRYGTIGLLGISASPLPEMPALMVLGVAKPDTAAIFIAVMIGKWIKYGVIAWLASHFPERFTDGVSAVLRKFWWR